MEKTIDARPDVSYPIDKRTPVSPVLPPSAPLKLAMVRDGVQLNSSDRIAMLSEAIVVFAHGKVTYTDVFGEPHWITFCFRYAPDTQRLVIHDHHNETD